MDQSSPLQPDLQRNRLPTLFEVLSRRALPPVDLFSFYVFMRDQQRSVDYLDFWLDVSQHTSLCRAYVRELRSTILSSTAEPRPPQNSTETSGDPQASSGQSEQQQPEESGTVDTSDPERSGQVLRLSQDDQPTEVPTPPPVDLGPPKDQIRGYFMGPSLRGGGSTDWLPTGSVSTVLSRTRYFFATFKSRRDPKAGEDRVKRLTQLNLRGGASNSSLPTYGTMRLPNSEDIEESAADSLEREGDLDQRVSAFLRGERASGRATPSDANDTQLGPAAGSSSRPSTDQGPATAGTISRQDIRASAEKIVYTYILPGAEREITLPGSMTEDLVAAVEVSDRDDPEVFEVVKDYVFKAMERDAFPSFLRMRAFANLTPPTVILHLILGLLSLFAAFWVGFVLIFLDMDRKTRVWLILPFTIGVYSLAVYQYTLDPTIALLQFSEYTPFSFVRVREPYVKKILRRRGIMVLIVISTLDAALSTLFIFVPGKRL